MAKPSEEDRKCLLASYTADAGWGRGALARFRNSRTQRTKVNTIYSKLWFPASNLSWIPCSSSLMGTGECSKEARHFRKHRGSCRPAFQVQIRSLFGPASLAVKSATKRLSSSHFLSGFLRIYVCLAGSLRHRRCAVNRSPRPASLTPYMILC